MSRYTAKGDERTFFTRLDALMKIGAIFREPWLCSSGGADADPIHPLLPDSDLATWADDAARRLLVGLNDERSWKSEEHPGTLVVLPVHHQMPAIQEVTRMRVEADTPGRRGAYGERSRIIAHWTGEYGRLEEEAGRGQFSNPVRTQVAEGEHNRSAHQGNQGHQGLSRTSNEC
jgi:hypothetical protein